MNWVSSFQPPCEAKPSASTRISEERAGAGAIRVRAAARAPKKVDLIVIMVGVFRSVSILETVLLRKVNEKCFGHHIAPHLFGGRDCGQGAGSSVGPTFDRSFEVQAFFFLITL